MGERLGDGGDSSRQAGAVDRKADPSASGSGSRMTAGPALGILVLVAVLYLAAGVPLQIALGEWGIVLAQLLFLALPPILFVHFRGYDLRRTFYLSWPGKRQLGGGILFLAGGTMFAWVLAWLQSLVIPVPTEFLEMMADFLTADSPGRFVWLLFMVALIPAVAEEVLFRGILLSGLRSRLPAVGAVMVCGLIFGVFHLAPETGFRVLPTAWLGMVLAWVVLVSGSLPLAMILHFLNNGSILALVSIPATRELVMGAEEAPPLWLLPLALALLTAGFLVLEHARRDEVPERNGGTAGTTHGHA